ncbi:MAG: DUF4402 domain-containing protein [Alphaproteobacteria bacterium]
MVEYASRSLLKNNMAFAAMVAVGVVFSVTPVLAQSASVNFTANAQIASSITISNTRALSFGNNTPGAGGTVVVDAAGTRTNVGTVAAGGTVASGQFSVSGAPSTAYSITLPATSTLTGPGAPMSVAFAASQLTGGSLTRTITNAGTDSFNLGGTLSVASTQASGSYSGIFTLTVAY